MPNIIYSSNGIGNYVNRQHKSIKIVSLHWIICILLVFILPATENHVHALNELHIGGIFPIGGKGGWQGKILYNNKRKKNFTIFPYFLFLHRFE